MKDTKIMAPKGELMLAMALSFLFALSSCGGDARLAYITIPEAATIPDRKMIVVPHIFQDDGKSCATTSVAMAVSHYLGMQERPLDKEEVWKISGTNEKAVSSWGNDMTGLRRIVAHYGLKGEYRNRMNLKQLEYLLSRDILVAINVKAEDSGNATHMVLAVGYDNERNALFVNDPANPHGETVEFPISWLDRRWQAWLSDPPGMSKQSGFIIYPKGY